ncbi:uncharacterized protein LOC108137330 [Drosophila elegans]|uniref:uncharacterized protein LOC108137330 n=1 Tax=Drosophila elegans TaxID=30023 RepID=UPI0007E68EE8|nr:uncharacterized protein LOC108137330 [Drosophila elegans]
MVLPPDRLEHYKTSLEQQLKRLASSFRSYQAAKSANIPELLNQANRLWELSQRYRLVKGTNQAAAFGLLSVCQDVYQSLRDGILTFDFELVQISVQVNQLETECLTLNQEQNQTKTPAVLTEVRNFLGASLELLRNHVKYMELNLCQLQPKFMACETSLEAFKSALIMPEYAEARISLGLAKIERLNNIPLIL